MLNLKPTNKMNAVLSVSELTAQIQFVLEDLFGSVAVVGEVSNAKLYPSGHWYFSLKDKDATLSCVCFKNANAKLKFQIEDGLMVVARGKLSVWPPRGAYQLVATALEPVGIGDWQLAFEQLRAKLEAEGLLAIEKKRLIPRLPKRIGVVTSTAGAALRDILSVLKRRNPNVNVVISPTKVQGEGSAEEIAEAIRLLHQIENVDVIIVARGGGSIEDLWSFNTEVVARAVAGSNIPIISGVGHETDVTICDLVADLRAPTPTAAAELVAAGQAELTELWSSLTKYLLSAVEQRLVLARHKFERLSPTASLHRYLDRLRHLQVHVLAERLRLTTRMATILTDARYKLHAYVQKLHALGPENVLKRGFAILRKDNGQVVSRARETEVGDFLEAYLQEGKLRLQVISTEAPDVQTKTQEERNQ